MNILVSACLLGVSCRYDGIGKEYKEITALLNQHVLIPICPEQLGGMETPRPPAERIDEFVMSREGQDVTAYYKRGAEQVLKLAKLYDCQYAILKERSPSCGAGQIYDGNFNGTLIEGDGVTAELLKKHGIQVIGEEQVKYFFTLDN